jgi:hypothetical protein
MVKKKEEIMKKFVALLAIFIGFFIVGWIASNFVFPKESKENVIDTSKTVIVKDSRLKDALSLIDEEKLTLPINEHSSEIEVIDVLHEMTHQKVEAEEKWGNVPMHPKTIDRVYQIINNSNFERKHHLLEIVGKWRMGDFSSADIDHNYFWTIKHGTVGKAVGLFTIEEEIEYIKKHFY